MLHVTLGQTWPAPSPLSSRTARGVIPSRIPKILSQGHAVTEGMKHGRPSYRCATLEGADRSVNQCLNYARIPNRDVWTFFFSLGMIRYEIEAARSTQ